MNSKFSKHSIKLCLAGLVFLVGLASCQVPEHAPFRKMTEEELLSYNAVVALADNVYCFEDVRTGSFIRKKYCMTLQEIIDQVNDHSYDIGLINYGGTPIFGGSNGGIGID